MNFTYFHWLLAGVAEDPGEQAEGRARRGGRQLRLEVLHAQGADLRGLPRHARRAAREVRRGPRSTTSSTTTTRLRPPVRRRARLRRRRHVPRAADRLRRRLRRLPAVRHRHARQRALADRRARTGSSDVEYSLHAVLTNKNQQGAYRGFGAEVLATGCSSGSSTSPRATSGMDRVEIRRRNLIGAGPVPVPDAHREHLRQRQLPGRAREDPRGRPTTSTGSPSATGRAPRAATSGSASSRRTSGASSARPSSGSGSTSRSSRRRRARRARACRSTRPGRSSSRCTRSALWGNSPETVVSQVVAEEFDVDPASVVVTYADSQHALPGTGPGRLALHGHGLRRGRGRRRRGEGQDQADRRPQARGERGRPRVPRRRRERRRRRRSGSCRSPRSRSRPTCSGSTCPRT